MRQQIPRAIARFLFNFVGIGCILALTASTFDATELVALAAITVLLLVVEAAVMCATIEPWWKNKDGKTSVGTLSVVAVLVLATIAHCARQYMADDFRFSSTFYASIRTLESR